MTRAWIPETECNATVVEVFPQRVRVHWDDGGELLCVFRRASIVGKMGQKKGERTPLVIGDRVRAEKTGVVNGAAERGNFLSRKSPDRGGGQIHVIAANIDQLIIVSSAAEPEFNPGIIDRYWIAAQSAGIPCQVVVNKVELSRSKPWDFYRELGLTVSEISAKSDLSSVERLRSEWRGKCSCFCGHSGVGKTTLLNALLSGGTARTGDVNSHTKKGSHTTSSAVMHWGPDRSRWIDTPGVRAFAMVGIEPEDLYQYFPEFGQGNCAQPQCDHLGREGCDVTEMIRYASYRRIHEALIDEEALE